MTVTVYRLFKVNWTTIAKFDAVEVTTAVSVILFYVEYGGETGFGLIAKIRFFKWNALYIFTFFQTGGKSGGYGIGNCLIFEKGAGYIRFGFRKEQVYWGEAK